MKRVFFALLASLLAGCIYVPNISISEDKLLQIIEVKDFLDKNDISLQKLKKCIELAEQIELNGSKISVTNEVMVIDMPQVK